MSEPVSCEGLKELADFAQRLEAGPEYAAVVHGESTAALLRALLSERSRLIEERDEWKSAAEDELKRRRNLGQQLSAAEAALEQAKGALEAIAGRENECGNEQWDPKEGRWRPIREIARSVLSVLDNGKEAK